ncbi:MAG: polyribonucleotide nucleotidyltransferase [Deltaproteobacteria bacterium]|jgi:polyribonucleotide nucleotidyltransferase|nr:polyribonucleotide nucleotidyltransferase [Deltaproteobacteria bacterium]
MKVETKFGDARLSIETGKVARQAAGSVVVAMGETIVLVAAQASEDTRDGLDFLPLTVDYQERLYAVGRIPGNFFRRELGRGSEKETLTSRIIDRPIRPLITRDWTFETQIIAQALSVDDKYDPDMLALLGASTALTISDIPFDGPIAGARVCRVEGEFVVGPTQAQVALSDLTLIVVSSADAVVMVEGGAREAKEEDVLKAIFLAKDAVQPLIKLQLELQKAVGKEKRRPLIVSREEKEEAAKAGNIALAAKLQVRDQDLIRKIIEEKRSLMREALFIKEKSKRQKRIHALADEIKAEYQGDGVNPSDLNEAVRRLESEILRGLILNEGQRIDGRSLDQVRDIDCEVSFLPRAHGSAVFTRGETQSLGVATLGSSYDEQRLESLIGDTTKNFMLNYNFPPFSTGEVKRLSSPGRREIGHGALAERALRAVLPPQEKFPYTIRVVSEILESNGSSSMATVCSATLSLMDAGVPIKAPVAGVAMGLVVEGDRYVVLTDILGDEDHMGDMDFKVAGSAEGVTAIQMDIKIKGVTTDIMKDALEKALNARRRILERMAKCLSAPRADVSKYAPKMTVIDIPAEKIKDVIGPGGKIIKAIQAETETRLDVEDSGKITIFAPSQEKADLAIDAIRKRTDPRVNLPIIGKDYEGKVVKIVDFGAFVEILPGVDGLVHISQLAKERLRTVRDAVREGDVIKVRVLEIDRFNKIRLSRRAVLEEE